MNRSVQILSHDGISQHVEVLERERSVAAHGVGAQGTDLDLGEITNQRDCGRVEVTAHVEEPDRARNCLYPRALTHRPGAGNLSLNG